MASSIVKSAAKQLGNLLVEEAKHLYKVRDKVEKLQIELEWMECFLRDADTQQHKEERWVSQVRDLAYDAEDLIQRYLHQVSHHRRDGFLNTLKWFSRIVYTCDAWTHHILGSDIEDMTIQISDLTSRLRTYGIQIIKPTTRLQYNSSPMSREARMTYSHINEDVVGFEKDIKQVVEQVLSAKVKVVSISGTGGLGKTTLARKVFKSKQIQDGYTCAWVCISQDFDTTHIFKDILRGLGEKENVGAAEEIDKILREKKCFVVLDDIWKIDAWKRLEPAFVSIFESYNSKILITTRKQDLLQPVSSVYLHRLKPLSPKDSWELLRRKAFLREGSTVGESREENEPQDDGQVSALSFSTKKEKKEDDDEASREKLGREMLKHCDGIPLAIVTLGGILSTRKTINEWKDVQENIVSYLMSGEQRHENGRISQVLELSYHDLPFYLKPCFLCMGSFPEDYEISAHRLYHLWQAEGLLIVEGKAAKTSNSYDVGERYLNELAQRSMVQVGLGEHWEDNGRIKTCKLHDIMRDLCLKKGDEINFLNTVEDNELFLEKVLVDNCTTGDRKLRRFAVHWIADRTTNEWGEISYKYVEKKATCVRSLLVFPKIWGELYDKHYVLLGRVWKPFPLLRVLDLEDAPIEGVLEGVEKLIHLRFLSLKGTYITELPVGFWDLKCLETLDLRWGPRVSTSSIRMRLPSKQLGKLGRLRHLYLPMGLRVMEYGERLSLPASCRMEALENFDPGRCEINDLHKMTNLRFFHINLHSEIEDKDVLKGLLEAPIMRKSGQLLNTPCLIVRSNVIEEVPTVLSSLAAPPSSFALRILQARSGEGLSSNTVFADSLTFVDIDQVRHIGDAPILALGKLSYLTYLRLYRCNILGGNKMTFSAGSFPQLIQLYLCMSELEEWEVEDGALPKLQDLHLISCDALKKLPQGLPQSVDIQCDPCIRGIENYKTCKQLDPLDAESCYDPLCYNI